MIADLKMHAVDRCYRPPESGTAKILAMSGHDGRSRVELPRFARRFGADEIANKARGFAASAATFPVPLVRGSFERSEPLVAPELPALGTGL